MSIGKDCGKRMKIKLNKKAPNFKLMSTSSKIFELSKLKNGIIIYFYPKDFTFICPTEIIEFASINDQLENKNCVLIGGSTDNEFCKLAWRREHPGLSKLNHRSFADPQGKLTSELGLMSEEGVAYRATMIVDPDNIVQHICVNALDTGRNADEVLRTLQALKAGGLTGCSWNPGEEFVA